MFTPPTVQTQIVLAFVLSERYISTVEGTDAQFCAANDNSGSALPITSDPVRPDPGHRVTSRDEICDKLRGRALPSAENMSEQFISYLLRVTEVFDCVFRRRRCCLRMGGTVLLPHPNAFVLVHWVYRVKFHYLMMSDDSVAVNGWLADNIRKVPRPRAAGIKGGSPRRDQIMAGPQVRKRRGGDSASGTSIRVFA